MAKKDKTTIFILALMSAKVAQMKLFEKSMRGPFCDEKIIYSKYVRMETNLNIAGLME
ncbi:hypothetical protein HYE68_008607 [Fusarium pseudograminearum]|nr:hypothetical protein HYE68_008607 [Fusarium pseudograminearum]